MAAKGLAGSLLGGRPSLRQNARQQSRVAFRAQPARASAQAAPAGTDEQQLGFNMMRKGIKEASAETVLTPRFYTTDFDEMEVNYCSKSSQNDCEMVHRYWTKVGLVWENLGQPAP